MCRSQGKIDDARPTKRIETNQFDQRNIKLLSVLSAEQLGYPGADGSDLWGWTDRKTGHDYALMTFSGGTSFVDISNGKKPKYIGKLPSQTGSSYWRDIKISRHYAYIVSDQNGRHGLQIFNLKRLRNSKPNTVFKANSIYKKIHSAHNMMIHNDYAYIVGGKNGRT